MPYCQNCCRVEVPHQGILCQKCTELTLDRIKNSLKSAPTRPPSSGASDAPECKCKIEIQYEAEPLTVRAILFHCPLHNAAPDLYTALEAILKVMRPGIDGHDDLLHVWLNYPGKPEITPGTLARAALTKARGEA